MTKLFKKFFIATLSFVMMIACAFTFTTYKASASTNADVPAKDFTTENVAVFASATAGRVANGYSSPSCLIVDSQLFSVDGISVSVGTSFNDVSNSTFLHYFAMSLGAHLGIRVGVDGLALTVEDILEEAEMEIVVHITNRTFKNLTTDVSSNLSAISFTSILSTSTASLYSAIVWETPIRLYSILSEMQYENYFPVYAFPREDINYSSDGLIISGWLGAAGFDD